MTRLFGFFLAAILSSSWISAGPLTERDRQRLVAHFEMTNGCLQDEIAGLSPSQMQFRMADGAWTVKDVVEHLAIAEAQYWTDLQASMAKPATAEKAEVTDEAILWYGIDRTVRQKTGEAREPKGQFESAAKAFEVWKKLRVTLLNYAKSTDEDLRGHRYLESKMDAYQWLLMISTHSERHIQQIREIKHHAKFPTK